MGERDAEPQGRLNEVSETITGNTAMAINEGDQIETGLDYHEGDVVGDVLMADIGPV